MVLNTGLVDPNRSRLRLYRWFTVRPTPEPVRTILDLVGLFCSGLAGLEDVVDLAAMVKGAKVVAGASETSES